MDIPRAIANAVGATCVSLGFACAQPPAASPTADIVFVTQTPNPLGALDFATVTSVFGNHRGTTEAAPRGGSLFIQYSDGSVRNILDEAFQEACLRGLPTCDPRGYRVIDGNGLLTHGVAVRDPVVHWDGDKVLFAMSIGAVQHADRWKRQEFLWQLYEVEGLSLGDSPTLRKISGQPASFNNIDAVYGSDDDEIFFFSDRPITGNAIHYPQLDEYESIPTVSGLWKLNRSTGALTVLDHAPSGGFDPVIDSNGHIIYTRWDHMQADQQATAALEHVIDPGVTDRFGPYTYANENDARPGMYELVRDRSAAALNSAAPDEARAFDLSEGGTPEPHPTHPVYVDPAFHAEGDVAGFFNGAPIFTRAPSDSAGRKFRPMFMHTFMPWQINQDGSNHISLRHIGRHETIEYVKTTFIDDPNLSEHNDSHTVWAFNISEDGAQDAVYLANTAKEAKTHSSGAIFSLTDSGAVGGLHENANALDIDWVTNPDADDLYRDPIRHSDGRLIAAFDRVPLAQKSSNSGFASFDFQIFSLSKASGAEFYVTESAPLIAPILATFDYYEGGGTGRLRQFSGPLWALSPKGISARNRPPLTAEASLHAIDEAAITAAGADLNSVRQFLSANNLALIAARNVTKRDDIDKQQPFNLYINHPSGVAGARTVNTGQCEVVANGDCAYGVRFWQIYENKLIRGYERYQSISNSVFHDNGRRGLARPMDYPPAVISNPAPDPSAPPGSVLVAPDGSAAALVPANRALTWLLTDAAGNPIVRERVWVTFKSGKIRVCGGCHGANELDQAGEVTSPNTPQALEHLIADLINTGMIAPSQ